MKKMMKIGEISFRQEIKTYISLRSYYGEGTKFVGKGKVSWSSELDPSWYKSFNKDHSQYYTYFLTHDISNLQTLDTKVNICRIEGNLNLQNRLWITNKRYFLKVIVNKCLILSWHIKTLNFFIWLCNTNFQSRSLGPCMYIVYMYILYICLLIWQRLYCSWSQWVREAAKKSFFNGRPSRG